MNWNDIALLAVLIAVVFLPLASERTERNFELFLFAAGAIALSISHSWGSDFIIWTVKAPLGIAATVLVFGLAFYYGRKQLDAAMDKLADRLSQQVIVFLAVVALGFLASVITGVTKLFGDPAAQRVRILYGGSMKPSNAAELLGQADIDGGLIGGASLESRSFLDLIKAAADAK